MNHDYVFLESTISICSMCRKKIEAKIIRKINGIFIRKLCPIHGQYDEILEEDPRYYTKKPLYYKPGTGCKTQTLYDRGCPWDCGLCPQHEQHTCIGLIEITQKCNLHCPTCYANSHSEGKHLSIQEIESMMDFYQDTEYGKADILQISGGEPTIHPDIIEILHLARKKGFKYIMLNTNGLRLAEDELFAAELGKMKGGFELYFQYDDIDNDTQIQLRGKDLSNIKEKAFGNIEKYKIPTTLVATIQKGVNDQHIGELVTFSLNKPYVRGINFQPVAFFGRGPIDTTDRITLSGIINKIEQQTKAFIKFDDFIPLPCDPDRVALTYLHKKNKGKREQIVHKVDISNHLDKIKNTFAFNLDDIIEKKSPNDDCCNNVCNPRQGLTKMLAPKLFLMSEDEQIEYINNHFFRISIKSFIDIYNFDIRSVQKDCVHIITPDLKKYPFSTYNMFYR